MTINPAPWRMTAEQWARLSRHGFTGRFPDGTRNAMRLESGGTTLVPVEIVKAHEADTRTADGYVRAEGATP